MVFKKRILNYKKMKNTSKNKTDKNYKKQSGTTFCFVFFRFFIIQKILDQKST